MTFSDQWEIYHDGDFAYTTSAADLEHALGDAEQCVLSVYEGGGLRIVTVKARSTSTGQTGRRAVELLPHKTPVF